MNTNEYIIRYRRTVPFSAPEAPVEAAEPTVCTLYERCKDCPYPGHGFICWGPDGGCLRQSINEKIGGNVE